MNRTGLTCTWALCAGLVLDCRWRRVVLQVQRRSHVLRSIGLRHGDQVLIAGGSSVSRRSGYLYRRSTALSTAAWRLTCVRHSGSFSPAVSGRDTAMGLSPGSAGPRVYAYRLVSSEVSARCEGYKIRTKALSTAVWPSTCARRPESFSSLRQRYRNWPLARFRGPDSIRQPSCFFRGFCQIRGLQDTV